MVLDNVPQEIKKSAGNIQSAAKEGYRKSSGLTEAVMNVPAYALTKAAGEAIRLPTATIVRPTAGFLLQKTKDFVKGAIRLTGRALLSIPWIGVPRRPSPEEHRPVV